MANSFCDLVFVIPGILGTRLARVEDGKRIPVWDLSVTRLPAAIREIGRGGLIFTGSGDAAPNDGFVTNGLLDVPQWIPGFFGVDGYGELVQRLRAHLGTDRVREFPYDWRLSNAYTAKLLKEEIDVALPAWRVKSGNSAAKLVLIGHSMGGMIARYYCEKLGGAPSVRMVVTIGTPHRGAIPALDGIVNGKKLLKIVDMSKELRSLPSVYELLPIFPCLLNGGKPQKIIDVASTLPHLDQGRWKQAVAFHESISAPALERAESGVPCPYEQIVFYSQRQPTFLSARLDADRLVSSSEDPFGAAPGPYAKTGDGTVPWFSAFPIEWQDDGQALAAPGKHAALQTVANVIDTIAGRLAPDALTAYRGAPLTDKSVIKLRLSSPVVATDDTLQVEVDTQSGGLLGVTLTHLAEGEKTHARFRQLDPGGGTAQFEKLEEGVHRVVVAPTQAGLLAALPPVSDYVLVLSNG
jgi:pimeloyl-ACP methyl ester carboxylesterase